MNPWEKARSILIAMNALENDWDGDGAVKPDTNLVYSAGLLLNKLLKNGHTPPSDAYPTTDGHIVFEWLEPGDVRVMLEIEREGYGEKMTTYPNLPAKFEEVTWEKSF